MINTTKFPLELSHHDNFIELSSHRKHRKLTDDRKHVGDFIYGDFFSLGTYFYSIF